MSMFWVEGGPKVGSSPSRTGGLDRLRERLRQAQEAAAARAASAPPKRGRGRPKGSKGRPKAQAVEVPHLPAVVPLEAPLALTAASTAPQTVVPSVPTAPTAADFERRVIELVAVLEALDRSRSKAWPVRRAREFLRRRLDEACARLVEP